MEKSLLVIFGEIWPKSLYYSTGTLAQFWSNFKNTDKKDNTKILWEALIYTHYIKAVTNCQ